MYDFCQKHVSSILNEGKVQADVSLSVKVDTIDGHICNVKIQSMGKLHCHVIDSLCVILFKSMGAKLH